MQLIKKRLVSKTRRPAYVSGCKRKRLFCVKFQETLFTGGDQITVGRNNFFAPRRAGSAGVALFDYPGEIYKDVTLFLPVTN